MRFGVMSMIFGQFFHAFVFGGLLGMGKKLTKLAEMKTGRVVTFPALADLPKLWEAIPRRKVPDERYAHQWEITLERFATFPTNHQRGVSEFVAVNMPKTRPLALGPVSGSVWMRVARHRLFAAKWAWFPG
jgi:hypothetical protein